MKNLLARFPRPYQLLTPRLRWSVTILGFVACGNAFRVTVQLIAEGFVSEGIPLGVVALGATVMYFVAMPCFDPKEPRATQ